MVKAPILESITVTHILDQYPDLSHYQQDYFNDNPEYPLCTQEENEKYKAQDQRRLELYDAGYWNGLGIKATASIKMRYKGLLFIHEINESIWGLESDDSEGIKRCEQEQIDIIKEQVSLKGIAISPKLEIIISEKLEQ